MKKICVGINGFGRIGRIASRIILSDSNLDLVAINSRADIASNSYLLKYDSTYGVLKAKIAYQDNQLVVDGKKIKVFRETDPNLIPWNEAAVDLVIESTGQFRTYQLLFPHLRKGVKYVILSAPAKDDLPTVIMGVNHEKIDMQINKIFSNSSCTTNCLATTLKVLADNFNVERGFMTTIHAVTDSQNLLDNSHPKEKRLRRSAIASMIPASSGSARDIGKLFPDLADKLICRSIRVPLSCVSLIDLTVDVKKHTSKDAVNEAFIKAANTNLSGIIEVSNEELVSSDFIGNNHSAIIDPFLTGVIDGTRINVFAWYDNEWGYASRLVDLAKLIGIKGGLLK